MLYRREDFTIRWGQGMRSSQCSIDCIHCGARSMDYHSLQTKRQVETASIAALVHFDGCALQKASNDAAAATDAAEEKARFG